jgi:hypothetical protein
VENAKSDCDIRLLGRDESDEGSLSGYSPGRDLNRRYLGYRVKFISVDLPKLFIRILKIYERSKTHSLFFFTVFFKHVGSVEMILGLTRDRLSSDQFHISTIFAPEEGALGNSGKEFPVSISFLAHYSCAAVGNRKISFLHL